MSVKIETLELEIRSQADTAAKGVEHLSEALKHLKSSTLNARSITTLTRNIQSLNSALNSIDEGAVNKLTRLADSMDKLAKASGAMKIAGLANKNKSVGDAIKAAEKAEKEATANNIVSAAPAKGLSKGYKAGADNTKNIVNAMAEMGKSSFAVELLTNKLKGGLGKAFDFVSQKAFSALRSIPSLLGKCATGAISLGASLTKSIGSKIHGKLKDVTKKFTELFKSMKRIALYRLMRSAIKAITEGFSEGIKAVSRYSRSIDGQFSKTMDSLQSQLALMKGSLGAMAAPLIEMLAPAIMTVTNAVIQLANALNQVFSLLSGKGSWTKATSAVQKYDDTVSGASGNTKKLTAAIDELNVLNESSGGGSGTNADYGFEEQQFSAWADNLKKLLDVGKYKEFGEGLADLINNAIESWDAEATGRKLGDKIEHAIEIGYGFITKLDTETLGGKVATFFNSALDRIDTNLLGKTMGEKWNRVVDFFYGIDAWLDWKQLSDKVVGFFKGAFEAFDVDKLALTVSNLLNHIIEFVSNTLRGITDLHLGKAIIKFVTNLNWVEIGTNTGKLITTVFDAAFTLASDLMEGLQSGSLTVAIVEFICGAIENINLDLIELELKKLITQILGSAFNIFDSTLIAGVQSIAHGTDFAEEFKKAQNTGPLSSILANDVKEYDRRIAALKAQMPKDYEEVLTATEARAKASGAELAKTAQTNANSTADAYKRAKDSISSALDEICNKASETTSKMSVTAAELGNTVAQPWATVDDLKTKTADSFANIQQVTETSWMQIKNTTEEDWNTIQKKVESTWSQLEEKAKERFGNIETIIKEKWKNILADTTEKWGITGSIPVLIKDGMAIAEAAFTSFQNTVETTLTNAYTSIDTFVTKSCNRLDALIEKVGQYNETSSDTAMDINFKVKGYATGGAVSSGNLFFANENGAPELVGSIGNTTSVMNNDQIVSAVSMGVYDAVVSAMSQSNGKPQTVQVFLNGKQIEASSRETKQRRGATIASGGIYNFA